MSAKLLSVVAALSVLSSVAAAVIITPSGFGANHGPAYRTQADFDWAFDQFRSPPGPNRENLAERGRIRQEGLTPPIKGNALPVPQWDPRQPGRDVRIITTRSA